MLRQQRIAAAKQQPLHRVCLPGRLSKHAQGKIALAGIAAEGCVLDRKTVVPEPVRQFLHFALRLQNEPFSLPQPRRGRQDRTDRFPAHAGNGDDIRCLRVRKLQTVRLHEPNALLQVVSGGGLPRIGKRTDMDVGRDGRLNDSILQQPDRQISVICTDIRSAGARRHEVRDHLQPR